MVSPPSRWLDRSKKIYLESRAFIDGKYVSPENGKFIRRYSPIDGKLLGKITDCSVQDVDKAVSAARKAFHDGRWRNLSLSNRKSIMLRIAELIKRDAEHLALLDSLSMGKAITQCLHHDIHKASECFAWYAEAIDKIYDKAIPPRPNTVGLITREPLGVIGAITPWNYPMENISWKIAPALAAGNSIVLKPAEQASFSALHFAQLAAEAGIPDGVLNILPGRGEVTGRAIASHNDIDGVFFTGSSPVGKNILKYSGISNMKRVCLECGGKSAFIVLEDCRQLDEAAESLSKNIFMNQGQTCSAPSRLIIQASIRNQFIEKLLQHSSLYEPNNPLLESTRVGALVSKEQLQTIETFVETGKREGALLLTGGRAMTPVDGGFYFSPTIFDNVKNEQAIAQEEIFGPVLCIITADSPSDALEKANRNKYGLAAGIWSENINLAHDLARNLCAGTVHVNSYGSDDITAPFGGYKHSGNGSKDKSLYALDDYSNIKTTWIEYKKLPST